MFLPVIIGLLLGGATAVAVARRETAIKRRIAAAKTPSWLRNNPWEKKQQDILEIEGDKTASMAPFGIIPGLSKAVSAGGSTPTTFDIFNPFNPNPPNQVTVTPQNVGQVLPASQVGGASGGGSGFRGPV